MITNKEREELAKLELVLPPLPVAALMAKPLARGDACPTSPTSPTNPGLEQQVADLREVVARLANRVKQLEGMAAENMTVCCECGVPGCRKAPLVPMRYWMRYGPMSFRYFSRDNPEGARSAEREFFQRRYENPDAERLLGYDPYSMNDQPGRKW